MTQIVAERGFSRQSVCRRLMFVQPLDQFGEKINNFYDAKKRNPCEVPALAMVFRLTLINNNSPEYENIARDVTLTLQGLIVHTIN